MYAGQQTTLVATVTAAANTPVNAGQILFLDGATQLATVQGVAQSNGSLKATLTTILKGNRVHPIVAAYLGAPNSKSRTARSVSAAIFVQSFSSGLTGSSVQLSEPSAGTLTATISTAAPVVPTGTVSFIDQSTGQTLGTANVSGSTVLPLFTPSSWPAGQGPGPFVSADFNGDGRPDFAVLNATDHTVSVFLNRGDQPGRFLPPQTFPVGPNPTAIAVADFNADGLLDLAVANSDNTITILWGTGNITLFQPATIAAGVSVGGSLLAADVNGDGLPDLVFVAAAAPNGYQSALDVLLNTANAPGTFSKTPSVIGLSTPAHFLAAADFNLDGIDDLVVDNAIYLSTASPLQFAAPAVLPYACNCQASLVGIAVANLTANAVPDIAFVANSATAGPFVDVALADPAHPGKFLATAFYPWPTADSRVYSPAGITIGDLNADGVPDIFTYGSVFDSVHQSNSPVGTVSLAVTLTPGIFSPMESFAVPAGLDSHALFLDLNADGIADLAFTSAATESLVTALSGLAETVTLPDVSIGGSGLQFIVASYSGNPSIRPGASPVLQLPGNGPAPVSVQVVPSALTAWTSLPLTLSVSVSEASDAGGLAGRHPAIPSGTVTLWEGSAQLTSATLDSAGNAVLTPSLAPGDHTLTVTYSGDPSFASATATSTTIHLYGSSNAAVFDASPNPIQAGPGGFGQTTIQWNAPAGVSAIQILVNAPDGVQMTQAGPSGSIQTGPWVTDGMTFYLQALSGSNATPNSTLGMIRMHLQPDATFWAVPNPIPVAPGMDLGMTNLLWSAPNTVTNTEIHVGGPNGVLLGTGSTSGTAATGLWVNDGMTFYLQDVTGGNPLTAQHTVDSVALNLAPQVMFSASPSPLPSSFLLNNQQVGSTTLSWSAPNSTQVRVRIGSPTGNTIATGGSSGSATASGVVADGTTFYLEDASGGPIDGSVLGTILVNLEKPVQFAATPNPISAVSVVNGVETGQTILSWNTPGRSSIAIVLARPGSSTSPTVATGGASGSVSLAVQNGDEYLLEDTSVSPAVIIGTATILFQHQVSFTATPNPAPIQYSAGTTHLAMTTLKWNASGVGAVAITIGQPNGVEVATGGASGSVATGLWVTEGMTFYLQDITGGLPLTAANTLGVVSVRLH